MKNKSRILILGGNGFIGSKLRKKLLENEFNVISPTKEELNLTDNHAVSKLAAMLREDDILVFLACITPDKACSTSLFLNLKIGMNVVQALKLQKIKKIIYFSTDAVYSFDNELITENIKPNPSSIYGSMHLMREMLLKELDNIKCLIIRPTMIYGLNDTHNAYGINRFLNTAIQEKKIYLNGSGFELRDYVHIDDLIHLTESLIKKDTDGLLNIASGRSYSFYEITNIIKNECNGNLEIFHDQQTKFHGNRQFNITAIQELMPEFQFKSINSYVKDVFNGKE